jgi:hypothetical protein
MKQTFILPPNQAQRSGPLSSEGSGIYIYIQNEGCAEYKGWNLTEHLV